MHDFFCVDPDEMCYSVLADRARYFKEDERGINEMGSLYERLVSEGEARGIIRTLASLVRDGILTIKDAAARGNMTETEFRSQMSAFSL